MPLTLTQLRTPITRAQALQQLLDEAQALGFNSSSWGSGSVQRTMLDIVAEVWSQLSLSVDGLSRAVFNDTSDGDALTEFSDSHYDNQRVVQIRTIGLVDCIGAAVGPPHVIAIGQLVVADDVNGFTYRNTTAGTIPVSGTLTLSFQAEVAGVLRNVPNAQITTLNTPLTGVTVNNPDPGSGTWITTQGVDEEADVTLQTRNSSKWGLLNITVPEDGYINLALGADTDVTRASVDDSNPRGAGTVDVYIARATAVATGPETTPGTDAATVLAAFNTRRAVTADASAVAAAAVAQALTATIHVTTALLDAAKEAEIEAAASAYINGLDIGGTILPPATAGAMIFSELVGAVTAIEGVQSVVFAVPTANVPIAANTIMTVGAITFTYVAIP